MIKIWFGPIFLVVDQFNQFSIVLVLLARWDSLHIGSNTISFFDFHTSKIQNHLFWQFINIHFSTNESSSFKVFKTHNRHKKLLKMKHGTTVLRVHYMSGNYMSRTRGLIDK